MLPSFVSLLGAVGALVAVLALILLAGRLARWRGMGVRSGAGRRIVVEESAALDSRRRLHVVACDGRRVVLLTGGATDLVVGWLAGSDGP